jgi:hypothetical protein
MLIHIYIQNPFHYPRLSSNPRRLNFLNSFIHLCIHCLGNFSPLPPSPTLFPPSPPHFQAEPVLPYLYFCQREDISNNKKDKAFLLVDIRAAIQRDS